MEHAQDSSFFLTQLLCTTSFVHFFSTKYHRSHFGDYRMNHFQCCLSLLLIHLQFWNNIDLSYKSTTYICCEYSSFWRPKNQRILETSPAYHIAIQPLHSMCQSLDLSQLYMDGHMPQDECLASKLYPFKCPLQKL